MSGTPFHMTRIGRVYYEHTLPELVRQLTRLNDLLERLIDRQQRDPANEPKAAEADG
jgi:methyl coenzyme M reductase subunit C-like uncharacterized protein (methanogenesis marker protein 7)